MNQQEKEQLAAEVKTLRTLLGANQNLMILQVAEEKLQEVCNPAPKVSPEQRAAVEGVWEAAQQALDNYDALEALQDLLLDITTEGSQRQLALAQVGVNYEFADEFRDALAVVRSYMADICQKVAAWENAHPEAAE